MPEDLDGDLDALDRIALLTEAKRMRRAIRKHRDSIGHELCWHHPDMLDLLPDKLSVDVAGELQRYQDAWISKT